METIKLTKEEIETVLMIVEKHLDWIADTKSENFEGWSPEEVRELKNEWSVCEGILEKIELAMLRWEKVKDGVLKTHFHGQDIYRFEIEDAG